MTSRVLISSPSVQSRSQDSVLQKRMASTVSHIVPPFSGCVMTSRVLISSPPSQSAEHFDQPDHSESLQFTSHFFWPHFRFWVRAGHATPNSLAGVMISRSRVCQPPHFCGSGSGHESSHSSGSPPGPTHSPPSQSLTSQSEMSSGG